MRVGVMELAYMKDLKSFGLCAMRVRIPPPTPKEYLMDYITKIKEAMQLLHEACKMNEVWADCMHCPFGDYCDAMEEAGLGTPDDEKFIEFIDMPA